MSRAWLLAFFTLGAARGALTPLDGPLALAGVRIASPLLAVSQPNFDLVAELVPVRDYDWWHESCPPTYTGKEDLAGKLVVFKGSRLVCSQEEIGRALIGEGALGVVMLTDRYAIFTQVAGREYHSFYEGDSRQPLPIPMATAVGPEAAELFELLVDGGVRPLARLEPSPNRWLDMWRSPGWGVWQVLLALQSAIVLEFALARYYAFLKEDGRMRLNIAQSLLLLEAHAHALRFLFVVVDPYGSRGVFSELTEMWLLTKDLALASCSRALFLVFFTQAAANSGIATYRVSFNLRVRVVFVVTLVVNVIDCIACTAALRSNAFMLLKVSITLPATATPLLELVIYRYAYLHVVGKLRDLPATLFSKVKGVMGTSFFLCLSSFVFALLFYFSVNNPVSLAVVGFVFRSLVNAQSLLQVLVFRPLSVNVPVGPFGWLLSRIPSKKRAVPQGLLCASRVAPLCDSTAASPDAPGKPLYWIGLGVSLRFAREFIHALGIEPTDSVAVVRKRMLASFAGLPRGAGVRSAVELYRDARTLDGAPAVGAATVFVVHAPDAPYVSLVEAIGLHASEHGLPAHETFFWFDLFTCRPLARRCAALRQRELQQTVQTMRAARSVALALGSHDVPRALSSLTCAYHLGCCDAERVHIVLPAREQARFRRALVGAPELTRDVLLGHVACAPLECDDMATAEAIAAALSGEEGARDPARHQPQQTGDAMPTLPEQCASSAPACDGAPSIAAAVVRTRSPHALGPVGEHPTSATSTASAQGATSAADVALSVLAAEALAELRARAHVTVAAAVEEWLSDLRRC